MKLSDLNPMNWIRANAPQGDRQTPSSMELTSIVEITAAAAAEGETPKRPRFSISGYTGEPMTLNGWYTPVIVDLRGLRAARQKLPVLLDHDPRQIVGQADSVEIDDKGVRISGLVTGDDAIAQNVVAHAKNGFEWQASIGAVPERREFLESGKTAQVNGRTVTGPMIIARKAVLKEISFVALGADPKTSASVAATHGDSVMKFEDWLKANGFDPETINANQRAVLKAAFDAQQSDGGGSTNANANASNNGATSNASASNNGNTSAAVNASGNSNASNTNVNTTDPVTTLRAELAAETERINAVRRVCGGRHSEIEAQAIREGWTVDKTELAVLRASHPTPPSSSRTATGSGASDGPDRAAVIEAAMCITAGLGEEFVARQVPASQREAVMNAAVSRQYRGANLHMLMDSVIQASGNFFSGNRRSDAYVEAALQAEQMLRASGFTSLSLSGILGNVANKALLQAYQAIETTWRSFAAVRSHSDFKIHTRYRLDSKGGFSKVGPDGELKHIGLDEASYTNKVDTFGAIVSLTRTHMVNDDLSAFLEIPRMLGTMSATRVEEAVYVLLLSNPSNFFHANNRNLLTGSNSALSIDSLSNGKQKFLDQVDANNKPILVSPSILLVGSGLGTTAEVLLKETRIIDGTSTSKQPALNPHVGTLNRVVSPYINNTAIKTSDGQAISGQSNTAWYLFANPAVRAAIAVAFLNGQQTPTIESAQTDFSTLGMQWRGYHDFGVGMEDPVAAVKSNGAN